MSSGNPAFPKPIDPIEQLLLDFSSKHDFSIETLRGLLLDNLDKSPAEVLADLERAFNSGMVLCSPKARNGFSRAQVRKGGAARKQLTGPRKLRTAADRERVAEKLKAARRARS